MSQFFRKSLSFFIKQQTNILSAAFIIMTTSIISLFLGLIRNKLLVAIFGTSNTPGMFMYASILPDAIFQLIVAGALSTAFIPLFSKYLSQEKQKEAHNFASNLLSVSLIIFGAVSIILFIFSKEVSHVLYPGLVADQLELVVSLMRIILFGEILFIVGSFFSAMLQSYNHFFIPGIASALYNVGMLVGLIFLSPLIGIYGASWGVVIGAAFFVLVQIPMIRKIGYSFRFSFIFDKNIFRVLSLMWPRTITIAINQFGTIILASFISFMAVSGRNLLLFNFAQTLAAAPITLFGQSIAQAAFPVLSRQQEKLDEFKATFLSSFTQMLYLVLPFSVLILVLRIPFVRLVYGVQQFDWPATVLTGRTLAFLAVAIFARALLELVLRAFYALHDTRTPLIGSILSSILMIGLASLSTFFYHFGIEGLAASMSLASIFNLIILFIVLDRKTKGFPKGALLLSIFKIFSATFFTAFALYMPIKLLDQLVFDTTRTINLLALTGISSLAGLILYLFLTWLFDVKEASTYILLCKRIGNWRDILGKSSESLEGPKVNP